MKTLRILSLTLPLVFLAACSAAPEVDQNSDGWAPSSAAGSANPEDALEMNQQEGAERAAADGVRLEEMEGEAPVSEDAETVLTIPKEDAAEGSSASTSLPASL